MSEAKTVAARIKALREQRGAKQVEVAVELGISRGHLAMIETGRDRPGHELMRALAKHFDVSLDWLSEGQGDMRPARPLNEREALLLHAFRTMPKDEAEAHLEYMLNRARATHD